MLFVVFKKCFFSLRHRSLSRKANRYLMGIHFLEEFVFLVALTCLPWKIHLFPGSVGVQDCWRSRCGFTADVCLLCLVQATLSELMRSAEVRPNTSLFINVQDCSAKKKKNHDPINECYLCCWCGRVGSRDWRRSKEVLCYFLWSCVDSWDHFYSCEGKPIL